MRCKRWDSPSRVQDPILPRDKLIPVCFTGTESCTLLLSLSSIAFWMQMRSGSHCPFELLPYNPQPESAAGLASPNQETGLESLRLRQKEKIQNFKLKELRVSWEHISSFSLQWGLSLVWFSKELRLMEPCRVHVSVCGSLQHSTITSEPTSIFKPSVTEM